MKHTPYPVVLDACVLYPSFLRDLLIRLGLTGLYQPKWSAIIEDEWRRNLLADRTDLTLEQVQRTATLMNKAVPDAMITGFEPLIDSIVLPDVDDRHVVAAAVRSNAEIIVTLNLKDFPTPALDTFGIEALHPDDFIMDLFDLNSALVLSAVSMQRSNLRKPPISVDDYLAALLRQGMAQTVKELNKYRQLI
ncbi:MULTISPECIES: putative toxin-antitoxin system toxin component, PIN family [Gammaproteobacteria]|uniref:PIN domain-containing protein n=1 Tax=Gammaproteobacteria TaxID=1236 RepID=UPI0010770781|nr:MULTISPECIES: PIN domain-containing protein [Gammaproteobacteria]EAB9607635.1 PIN domain-containing protein [Salmonella enterica subsp. enterica serovar Infantis]EFF6322965.1 PIN domain-containing protein [Escherichia coli]EHD1574463.1 PIN domain-containing protein [Escherichia coli]EHE8244208.1 PIN domain-containing protein [Escherichia coli]EHU9079488.1 PIN domain-containing protein [Escherichia coli]